MKALIFAAGLGERMRPLTEQTPKPLLRAGGHTLIGWHLRRLAAAGIKEVIVNTSHLAEQFPAALGEGERWGLRIRYAYEGETPLETGGGMLNALSLLGDDPFIAVNGDIWTDVDFNALPRAPEGEAHLLLVDNPPHHPRGDFHLGSGGRLSDEGEGPRLTFAGVGVYRPALLDTWRTVIAESPDTQRTPPRFPLAPLLRAAMRRNRVSGQRFDGRWTDVGTPERLQALRTTLGE